MADSELRMYTIYDHPADYPRHWAVRASTIRPEGPVPDDRVQLADSLEEARALIPPGLTCIPRFTNDIPCIEEVWC
jgi:hypothetical protein